MGALGDEFSVLRSHFEHGVALILSTALAAGQAPAPWRTALQQWTGSATLHFTVDGAAARADDVRALLLAVWRAYEVRFEDLDRRIAAQPSTVADIDEHDDGLWAFRERLRGSVDEDVRRYLATVSPPTSVSDLFARASAQQATMPTAATPMPAPVTTVACRSCGSPRRGDNLYGACDFCGAPFFPQS